MGMNRTVANEEDGNETKRGKLEASKTYKFVYSNLGVEIECYEPGGFITPRRRT